jgi:hypothetical protein
MRATKVTREDGVVIVEDGTGYWWRLNRTMMYEDETVVAVKKSGKWVVPRRWSAFIGSLKSKSELWPIDKLIVPEWACSEQEFSKVPVSWSLRLLKRSIVKWGLLKPLFIDQNGIIIDGYRRHIILLELGWKKKVPCKVFDIQEEMSYTQEGVTLWQTYDDIYNELRFDANKHRPDYILGNLPSKRDVAQTIMKIHTEMQKTYERATVANPVRVFPAGRGRVEWNLKDTADYLGITLAELRRRAGITWAEIRRYRE